MVGEVIGIIGQIPRYYRVFTTSQFNHAKPESEAKFIVPESAMA